MKDMPNFYPPITCFFGRKQKREFKDLLIYELLNAAKSQILGVFINSFDELFKQLSMDFLALVDVSSMVPEIVTAALAMTLKDRDIDI